MTLEELEKIAASESYPYKTIPVILKKLAILVVRLDLAKTHPDLYEKIKNEDLTGALFYSNEDKRLYIFLHNEGQTEIESGYELNFSERDHFTIMHELGHYFNEFKNLDLNNFSSGPLFYRNSTSSKGEDIWEIRANEFAAEFLMPEERVKNYLEALGVNTLSTEADRDIINRLAKRYGVSKQAMLIRLKILKKLND